MVRLPHAPTRATSIPEAHPCRSAGKTHIWLDRSKLKQTNLFGGFADLQKGRRVEVKYEDAERREVAEWVKVEVT